MCFQKVDTDGRTIKSPAPYTLEEFRRARAARSAGNRRGQDGPRSNGGRPATFTAITGIAPFTQHGHHSGPQAARAVTTRAGPSSERAFAAAPEELLGMAEDFTGAGIGAAAGYLVITSPATTTTTVDPNSNEWGTDECPSPDSSPSSPGTPDSPTDLNQAEFGSPGTPESTPPTSTVQPEGWAPFAAISAQCELFPQAATTTVGATPVRAILAGQQEQATRVTTIAPLCSEPVMTTVSEFAELTAIPAAVTARQHFMVPEDDSSGEETGDTDDDTMIDFIADLTGLTAVNAVDAVDAAFVVAAGDNEGDDPDDVQLGVKQAMYQHFDLYGENTYPVEVITKHCRFLVQLDTTIHGDPRTAAEVVGEVATYLEGPKLRLLEQHAAHTWVQWMSEEDWWGTFEGVTDLTAKRIAYAVIRQFPDEDGGQPQEFGGSSNDEEPSPKRFKYEPTRHHCMATGCRVQVQSGGSGGICDHHRDNLPGEKFY